MASASPKTPLVWIRDTFDGLLAIQAALRGDIPLYRTLPSVEERDNLIFHGSVFVWEKKEAGVIRWNTSARFPWSQSRMLQSLLVYRQKKQGDDDHWTYDGDREDPLYYDIFSAHNAHNEFEPGGFMKRSMSTRVGGAIYTVINYVEPFSLLEDHYPFDAPPYPHILRVSEISWFARHRFDIHPEVLTNVKMRSPYTDWLRFPESSNIAPKLIFSGNPRSKQETRQQIIDEVIKYWAQKLNIAPHLIKTGTASRPNKDARKDQGKARRSQRDSNKGHSRLIITGESSNTTTSPIPLTSSPTSCTSRSRDCSPAPTSTRNCRYQPYPSAQKPSLGDSPYSEPYPSPPLSDFSHHRVESSASESAYYIAQPPVYYHQSSPSPQLAPLTSGSPISSPESSAFSVQDFSTSDFITSSFSQSPSRGLPASFDTFKFPTRHAQPWVSPQHGHGHEGSSYASGLNLYEIPSNFYPSQGYVQQPDRDGYYPIPTYATSWENLSPAL